MQFSIEIEVNSFIKKIFEKEFGNPYTLNPHNWEGRILLSLAKTHKSDLKKYAGNKTIRIIIPARHQKIWKLKHLSQGAINSFVQHLDNKFRKCLFSFIDSRLTLYQKFTEKEKEIISIKINEAIIDFCSPYGIIEKEIPLDNLLKDYYRKRKKGENLHFPAMKNKKATLLSEK